MLISVFCLIEFSFYMEPLNVKSEHQFKSVFFFNTYDLNPRLQNQSSINSLRVHICSGCASADEKVTSSDLTRYASYHIRSGSGTNSDTPVCIKMLDDIVTYDDELDSGIGIEDVNGRIGCLGKKDKENSPSILYG